MKVCEEMVVVGKMERKGLTEVSVPPPNRRSPSDIGNRPDRSVLVLPLATNIPHRHHGEIFVGMSSMNACIGRSWRVQ